MQVDLQCGYFDSVNHDRLYNTNDLNKSISLGMASEGIDRTFSGGSFTVSVSSGLTLTVSAGRGFYNDSWFYNDSAKQITLDQADSVYARHDYIVIEASDEDIVRKCVIKTLTGTPSDDPAETAPTLDDNTQLLLAYVLVEAGMTTIPSANVHMARSKYLNGETEYVSMNGFGTLELTRVGNLVYAHVASDGSGGTYTDSTGGQVVIAAADFPTAFRPFKNGSASLLGMSTSSASATTSYYNLLMLYNTGGKFTLCGKKTEFNACVHLFGDFTYLI